MWNEKSLSPQYTSIIPHSPIPILIQVSQQTNVTILSFIIIKKLAFPQGVVTPLATSHNSGLRPSPCSVSIQTFSQIQTSSGPFFWLMHLFTSVRPLIWRILGLSWEQDDISSLPSLKSHSSFVTTSKE